jgi:hypothetical protein|tara:strand:+ start:335 stop:508 length:174 start_codon:yes stop_codon:yes gene_type:complete
MIKKNVIIETPAYQEADIEALKRTLQWCKKQKTDKKSIYLLKKRINFLKQEINFMYG